MQYHKRYILLLLFCSGTFSLINMLTHRRPLTAISEVERSFDFSVAFNFPRRPKTLLISTVHIVMDIIPLEYQVTPMMLRIIKNDR